MKNSELLQRSLHKRASSSGYVPSAKQANILPRLTAPLLQAARFAAKVPAGEAYFKTPGSGAVRIARTLLYPNLGRTGNTIKNTGLFVTSGAAAVAAGVKTNELLEEYPKRIRALADGAAASPFKTEAAVQGLDSLATTAKNAPALTAVKSLLYPEWLRSHLPSFIPTAQAREISLIPRQQVLQTARKALHTLGTENENGLKSLWGYIRSPLQKPLLQAVDSVVPKPNLTPSFDAVLK